MNASTTTTTAAIAERALEIIRNAGFPNARVWQKAGHARIYLNTDERKVNSYVCLNTKKFVHQATGVRGNAISEQFEARIREAFAAAVASTSATAANTESTPAPVSSMAASAMKLAWATYKAMKNSTKKTFAACLKAAWAVLKTGKKTVVCRANLYDGPANGGYCEYQYVLAANGRVGVEVYYNSAW